MSCNISSHLIKNILASSSKVAAGYNTAMPNFSQVSVVKMLMAAPKSTNVFGKEWLEMCTVTMEFPASSYFTGNSLPSNKSDSIPTT